MTGIHCYVCLPQDLISEFVEHGVPLDVLVLDMDWHITFYDGTKDSVRANTSSVVIMHCCSEVSRIS